MSKKFVLSSLGIEVEIGKVALQANGSVWIRSGDCIVLSAVCASEEEREFQGFFPLTVEHRERPAAVGKFPGGFKKREAQLSESEVLLSRLIDRSVRPLFPEFYFKEVQISSQLLSSDSKIPSGVLAVTGASLALGISDIPFQEPVAAVYAYRIAGAWKFNCDAMAAKESDSCIVVAGTKGGISMVEGYTNDLSNEEMIEMLFKAHEIICELVAWQEEVIREVGKSKINLSEGFDWHGWQAKIRAALPIEKIKSLIGLSSKEAFKSGVRECKGLVAGHFEQDVVAGRIGESILKYLVDAEIKELLPISVYNQEVRFDGRALDQVRQISCEVGVLPASHGSALFQRGETQALGTLTLGTGQDAQKVESLAYGAIEQSFMLHYNFPAFSTGECRPSRSVSRREIGHGHLAEISFKHVLPDNKTFPYTIRSLVDILGSNGSSSMASVCVTSLALMDAGVPVSDAVAGVAMGLVSNGHGKYKVLTDILGDEDAFGFMDLKITGTRRGTCGLQLDVKHGISLTRELMTDAFARSEKARNHILDEMAKVISSSRKQLSPRAPQFVTLTISPSKIGAVIGTGGKVIKEIMASTECEIDIEDSGLVKVYGKSAVQAEKAVGWIKAIVGDFEIGAMFEGVVRKIADFGIFVELVPGCDGLVHISAIAKQKQPDVARKYKSGDKLKVKVLAVDKETGRIRLSAPDLE
ncbi:polyribonucleotide nucleotidyltransferase [Candidatus Dependentiae bacterium]|nr:polyribonucleotide nucleotidyltransferase [Candidatus Dependentiae bacterium]